MKKSNEKNSFYIALSEILADLPVRSQDIVKKRFGVGYADKMTLQHIGNDYDVSRERVRQIVSAGIKGAKLKNKLNSFQSVENKILAQVKNDSGISVENDIITSLGNDNDLEKGSIRFFIEVTDQLKLINIKKYPVLEGVIVNIDFDFKKWQEIHSEAKTLFEKNKETYSYKDLYEALSMNDDDICESALKNYLNVSSEIDYNAFGNWGLNDWDEINPRGVREKAIIILKENEKPMHFSEITKEINDSGLNGDKGISHQQTVHNELIKNENFVLIGRGIYALKSWGYENGTVEDVVTNVLKNANKPLSANDIVADVLEIRSVRPATIMVNLNSVACKIDGKYALAE